MKNIICEVKLTYNPKVKPSEREKITSYIDAVNIFRSIEHFNRNMELYECFYTMYLNRNNKVLSVMLISEGGTSGTVIDIKKILAPAILQNASAIILCHNHPSGNTKESQQDKDITKKIIDAAKLMDINIIDHIILTPESFLSFANEGLL